MRSLGAGWGSVWMCVQTMRPFAHLSCGAFIKSFVFWKIDNMQYTINRGVLFMCGVYVVYAFFWSLQGLLLFVRNQQPRECSIAHGERMQRIQSAFDLLYTKFTRTRLGHLDHLSD